MNQLSSAWKMSIAEAGAGIRDHSFSSSALTKLMLDRIAVIDPKLRSYVTVLEDNALKEAAAADTEIASGRYRGPLHGIPIAIKDIFDTKGVKTTACSRVRENYVPDQDCTVVRKFREAGAVILGKVTTHEFAFGFDSRPTKNPWNSITFPLAPAAAPAQQLQRAFALQRREATPVGPFGLPPPRTALRE